MAAAKPSKSSKSVKPTVVKAAAQNASGHAQTAIVSADLKHTEAIGASLTMAAQNAGSGALVGVAAINTSLISYGRDLVADTLEVGRQTIATHSLSEAVALQAAFAERRIHAAFKAVAEINALAETNAQAIWAPFAALAKLPAPAVRNDKYKSVA